MKFKFQLQYSYFIILLFFISAQNLYGKVPENCIEWFKNIKLNPKAESCLEKCRTGQVGMGNYECPEYCEKLCEKGKDKDDVSCEQITHPSLWSKFWKLPKWPWNIRKAQNIGTEARRKMREFSPSYVKNGKTCSSWNRGAGDAFRHCYWNCMMTKEFGLAKALDYSDTQEFMYPNKCEEAKMDYDNNRVGAEIGEKNGNCEQECRISEDLVILEEEICE